MAVREFALNEYVTWGIGTGGLDDVLFGGFTVAAIVKRSSFTPADQGALLDFAAGLAGSRGFFRYTDTDNLNYLRGQFQSPGDGPSWTAAMGWVLVAVTKAAGTTNVRYHFYQYDTDTWTHANSAGTVENDNNICDRVQTRFAETAEWVFRGRYAVMGVWGSVLSDLALEGLTTAYADWETASPMALWRFDQAATTTPIDDQTAGGANQSALVGSTVVTTDDPPGFSFAAGGPVALDGIAAAAADSSGSLAASRAFNGTAAAATDAVSTLTILRQLAGPGAAVSGFAGSLGVERPLSGVAASASSATGRLAEEVLAGTANLAPPIVASSRIQASRSASVALVPQTVPTAGGVT